MLVSIGKLSQSTLRWVPICQVFSQFPVFLHHFLLAPKHLSLSRKILGNWVRHHWNWTIYHLQLSFDVYKFSFRGNISEIQYFMKYFDCYYNKKICHDRQVRDDFYLPSNEFYLPWGQALISVPVASRNSVIGRQQYQIIWMDTKPLPQNNRNIWFKILLLQIQ